MRKIMLMASMLAMAMLAASPALAQTQEANQSNTQSGTASGGGDVVNNASNVVQQCQTGGQYVEGNGNVLINQQECSQIVNSVQAGEDASQAVSNVVDQDQNAAGVQYQYGEGQAPQQPTGEEEGQSARGAQVPADEAAPADEETSVAVEESVVEAGGTQEQAEAAASAAASAVAEAGDAEAAASAAASAAAEAGASEAVADAAAEAAEAEAGAVAVLPDTGGASLFTLGAGALLVAGGLLARRIVR